MTIGPKSYVLKGFRTLYEVGSISGLSDAELLERSSATGGGPGAELAFSALVERHGPMVLRVCRKSLGDPHDAHDAFQSTFLVLARKAEAIRDRRSVASFLHGVALRVSASSRAALARRRKHERIKAEGSRAGYSADFESPDEVGAVLHEEVGRLPGRYRDAVVLCYLEGRSYEEAAGHLRLPVGTIKSRLSWARERLRTRLVRRGLAPAAGAVATLLAAEGAHAAIALPSMWAETTVENALKFAAIGSGVVPASVSTLANTVLHTMMLNKIKIATVALAGLLTSGAVLLARQEPAPATRTVQAVRGVEEPDRLSQLESKLDRLITALEKSNERPPEKIWSTAGQRFESRNTAVQENIAKQAAPRASKEFSKQIAPKATQNSDVLARLERLEARMDRLEQRLMGAVPNPGQRLTTATVDVFRAQPEPVQDLSPIAAFPAMPAAAAAPSPATIPSPTAPPAEPATPSPARAPAPPAPPATPAPGGEIPPIIPDQTADDTVPAPVGPVDQ